MRTDPEIEAAFASFGTSTPPASANPASGRLIANVDALLDALQLTGPVDVQLEHQIGRCRRSSSG